MWSIMNFILVTQRVAWSSTYLSYTVEVGANIGSATLRLDVGEEAFKGKGLDRW
jgi:hypothetical protein